MLFEQLSWIHLLFAVIAEQESVIFFKAICRSRVSIDVNNMSRAKELYDKSLSLLLQNQREGKEVDFSRLNECENAIRIVLLMIIDNN